VTPTLLPASIESRARDTSDPEKAPAAYRDLGCEVGLLADGIKSVINTRSLTVYYGRHRGILDLNLEVRQGEIFGYLGPNGAGKTTTLRVLLDIIRPTRGKALVFGLDCQRNGPEIRGRVGYLPGELSLYQGMRGGEFLDTMDAMRANRADPAYRRRLIDRLNLDPSRRIREYSRGNKQKVGLVSAIMHRPELLILDEPTSGLDPLVQQTVLELVREAKAEGRTVFFSSHILSEVQAVCDRVGIIREGQLVAVEQVDLLIQRQFRRLRLYFDRMPPAGAFAIDGVAELSRDGKLVTLEVRRNLDQLLRRAAEHGIVDIESQPVTLEEVFMAYFGNGEGEVGGTTAA
jgi:ABC-2 type transport system ATP-binding protein